MEQILGALVTILLGMFNYISVIYFRIIEKKNFLGLGEGPVNDINGTFGFSEKEISIDFNRAIIL